MTECSWVHYNNNRIIIVNDCLDDVTVDRFLCAPPVKAKDAICNPVVMSVLSSVCLIISVCL